MPEDKEQGTPVVEGNPEEEKKELSTSERLFSDLLEEDTPKEEPKPEPDKPAEEEKPVEEPQKEEPKQEEPKPDPAQEYLDLEKFKNARVKEIVNGKEVEVTLKDLLGADQKNRAAEEKFREAAEMRKQAAEERLRLEEERRRFSSNRPLDQSSDVQEPDNVDPKIRIMEQQMQELFKQTIPLQIEANKKKMRDRFSDFDTIFPKMQQIVAEMPSTPENDRMIQFFDKDPHGQELLYYKARELALKENVTKQKDEPKRSNEAQMERPSPPIVKVASGSNSSRGQVDAYASDYNKLVSEAQQTGNWEKVLKLKGY